MNFEHDQYILKASPRGEARFSQDEKLRYRLDRWITPRCVIEERRSLALSSPDRIITFVMLNPSTADAFVDDPTIRRCISFATSQDADTLRVVNLFALRATDPGELKKCGSAALAGADLTNDVTIRASAMESMLIIAAWGNHGTLFARAKDVATRVLKGFNLHCLARSEKTGAPKHPLYLPKTLSPMQWRHP